MAKEVHVIQEQSQLSQVQLAHFGCNKKTTQRLVASGVLRVEKTDDFRADFVGIASSGPESLQFAPKYLPTHDRNVLSSEMKLVVRVLRKYSRRIAPNHPDAEYLRHISSGNEVSAFAVADALLTDYLSNGIYRPKIVRRKLNGRGSIDWPRTISSTSPYFSGRAPIYADVVTRISSVDSAHWVARLHLGAIAESNKQFGGLLGYQPIILDHELVAPLSPLPSTSFVKAALQRELSGSYTERSIRLIRLLQNWYLDIGMSMTDSLSLFGVNSFHTVWEAICGALFSNMMPRFADLIPKPEWKNASGTSQTASTLIPDIGTYTSGEYGEKVFLLLDAKYYRAVMPPNLSRQPGIADITKQLFYSQVLSPKLRAQGVDKVVNGFLFPRSGGELFDYAGSVALPGVAGGPISIFYLNAHEVLKRYLESNSLSDKELQEFAHAAV